MPEPSHVSGEAAIRALERLGFHRAGQHGAYVDLRRELPDGTAKGCVVPLQDELPSSVLMGILRQADIAAEEFARQL
jgi:predicted RNA binding protein YcfA (HicA-like mRNA interferase family)